MEGRFNEKEFTEKLTTKEMGKEVEFYPDGCGSTMDEARKGLKAGAKQKLFLAEYQTNGRGSYARKWDNAFGKDILCTVAVRSPQVPREKGLEPLERWFNTIRFAVPIAVIEGLMEIGCPPCWMKWPNDIICEGKKICGILVEVVPLENECGSDDKTESEEMCWGLAAGFGINVNSSFAEEAKAQLSMPTSPIYKAVSVKDILGHEVSREILLAKICDKWEKWANEPFDVLFERYSQMNKLIGQIANVFPKNLEAGGEFPAHVLRISPKGTLIVRKVKLDHLDSATSKQKEIRYEEDSEEMELVGEEVSIRSFSI
ncbi:putative Biotin-[acetyl-CoA-carboxylase] ligase [Monocercomonoides exilis]|uniref:putative Biotin-[acetyl-CoA-carboxylase] ligase n=1 Tax=Monocercomonoides exilis TaxID=2049356 RepID=UPI00355AABE1|nr:putative Biotin-[acetyl-CoA-carboxylase] ligase [Monocercomonoides exilis]|eukprot:MONOS_1905.1-p1 / transcript=MONOS_1905.1 / gene=MONOS_1905 / organism=Monocercomonoides_exilis_PA203 / gene_product=Biotin-[acetyl-CoA-carboxylase] ligase / transcript_product=Biotin-[acetyl-CoA-carboxylase] ligase / location=Mono_scaffold00036:122286-123333(-) / protein_length=315 / sequence_SO=supercontig / SO=protein_coding / is_pseudo=false